MKGDKDGKVHSSDPLKGRQPIYLWLSLPQNQEASLCRRSHIAFEVLTEENVKKLGGTIGRGAAGALAFGLVKLAFWRDFFFAVRKRKSRS